MTSLFVEFVSYWRQQKVAGNAAVVAGEPLGEAVDDD